MSSNQDEDKTEAGKTYPLDLAKPTLKIIPGRNMRLLTQTTQGAGQTSGVPTIITTNIVPQVIKQDATKGHITGIITAQNQPQVTGNITIQRATQITLPGALPIVAQSTPGTTYHVPRGPAVVASLNAPRSNVVTTIRAPSQGTVQGQAYVRPPRTPSPAQTATWLTNTSNGSQIKATVTNLGNKPQLIARPQVVSNIRPTTILQNAIIGQGQIFKPAQNSGSIQTLGTTVTLAQVLPNRTQTLVYSTGGTAHFATTPRITVANAIATQRQTTTATRPLGQVTATRVTFPATQTTARLVTPQPAVLATNARISTIPSTHQATSLGTTGTRIITTTQPNAALNRLTVTVTNPSPQIRASFVATPAGSQTRTLQVQGAKHPTQGTIHLAPMTIKSTAAVVTAATTRAINTPAATLVAQRTGSVVTSHAMPIAAKVFTSQETQQMVAQGGVFIQTPVSTVARRTSPGPTTTTSVPTTTVATYSLASNAYFYDPSSVTYTTARTFTPQATSFVISSSSHPRPTNSTHGVVEMKFNPIVINEHKGANYIQEIQQHPTQSQQAQDNQMQSSTKVTSSPRPSILRKREHEGSPVKTAKNLIPSLSALITSQPPVSPPSRPDSRNNGHSSGGSTTISATSSPGLADANDDSMPLVPMNKEEDENRPPVEVSPRKKPRKQNLAGNDMEDTKGEMQFLSDVKREDDSDGNSDGPQDGAPESRRVSNVRKPASASLLNSYRHTWKTTHNHYLRHSDVRPKDERKPTIMDLANQHRVLEKVNGWKIHHLTTQMDDLACQEQNVHSQLTELLKFTEGKDQSEEFNRITELIKGNLQRVKIMSDGMIEAKTNIMKIFDHKVHVADIISRCASKRNYKKREKS